MAEYYWQVLEAHWERLANAAAQAEGAAPFRAEIDKLARSLSDSTCRGAKLDIHPLQEAGAAETVVFEIVRALEAESLTILREQPSSLNLSAGERVVQRCIRHTLSPPAPHPSSALIVPYLQDGSQPAGPADTIRLASFLQGVLAATRNIVMLCDERGVLLYMNRKGQQITRYTCGDVLEGLTICDLLPESYVAVVQVRHQTIALADGVHDYSEMLDTVDLLAKDGQTIPVEISAKPLGTGVGIEGTVYVARDLRVELRLQKEYRHSQTYLEGIIANAPIGIITTDSDLVVLDANPASVALYGAPSAAAMVGQPLPSLSATVDSEFVVALGEVARRQWQTRRRYSFRSRFGVTVNCDLLTVPMHATSDTQGGILALMLDISDQISLEQSLIQSEKLQALGEIMAGVAHELNNPLTGILGYSQLLISAKVDANLKAKLEHITEEATRCRRIVQNLLSFSRRHEPETSLQSVDDLLQQTISLREYQLRVDGIDLTVNLDGSLPQVLVDPHEIQRVFLNIINNAQQALSTVENRKREFRIGAAAKDGHVHIRFEDNGPGIPKDKVSRVFDPFFTTKGIGEGTGLGLSVSYGIVHAHGGRITVSSTEGQGATFTVILPVNRPAE